VVSCTGEVLAARAAAGQQLSASGDLLRGCLAVVDAYLTFARGMLLSSPTVPVALDWAVAAAGLREKEPVSASLGFLSHLLGAKAKARGLGGHSPGAAGAAAAAAAAMAARAGGHANGGAAPAAAAAAGNGDTDDCGAAALQSVVAPKLEGLVSVLVLALCDTAPRQLLRALSNVLHLLLSSPVWRGPAAACLLRCLQSPELPGKKGPWVCCMWAASIAVFDKLKCMSTPVLCCPVPFPLQKQSLLSSCVYCTLPFSQRLPLRPVCLQVWPAAASSLQTQRHLRGCCCRSPCCRGGASTPWCATLRAYHAGRPPAMC
jgi:hypothetical protein